MMPSGFDCAWLPAAVLQGDEPFQRQWGAQVLTPRDMGRRCQAPHYPGRGSGGSVGWNCGEGSAMEIIVWVVLSGEALGWAGLVTQVHGCLERC